MKNILLYEKKKIISKKLKCYIIDIPIYHCCIKILFGKNAQKLEKEWDNKINNSGAVTRNYLKEEGSVAISFFSEKPTLEEIVHEFHHATDMIMDYISHKKDTESDEPSAYLIGYLVKEFMKIRK